MTDFPLEEIDRLLTTTKQVRKRLDLTRPVPLDTVLECIDVASRAPIGGNYELNRWLLIDDAETKRGMAELYRKVGTGYLTEGKAAIEQAGSDPLEMRIADSGIYLLDHLHEVPLMIVPLRYERPGDSIFDQASYFGSVAPGIWSLQLALRARGIGSAWTTLHLHHEKEAAELLGIPDTATQIALLPAAFYTGDTFHPAKRKPATQITYLNRWKQKV